MFKDTNQNFWQLACIQATAMGLAVMLIGEHLSNQFGVGVAITSLCIGNIILWIIGLSMFSMTYKSQGDAKHAIENVLSYFGKPIAYIAALVLMVAFISWFPVQIDAQFDFTDKSLANYSGWNSTVSLVSSTIFALLIIGVSTFGIRAIKWTCTCAFPLLVLYVIYALVRYPAQIPSIEWGVSFQGIILVVVIVFPGIINLPTFFRHARSRADGIFALALMTIFVIGFQAATIWMQISSGKSLLLAPYSPETGWTLNLLMALGFVALSTFCVNIVNIYFASAALELVVPSLTDARAYAFIGLIGIFALGIFKSEELINNIETVTNNFIGCLGAILLAGYLSRIVVTHRHRRFEKEINILCWALGCIISLVVFQINHQIVRSFISGIFTSLLSFVFIVFVEETIWSIRAIITRRNMQ